MSINSYGFTPANLVLDNTLELFFDLYQFTYSVYLDICSGVDVDTRLIAHYNSIAAPRLINEFEKLAYRRNRIFSQKRSAFF